MIKLLDHNIAFAESRDAHAHLPDHVGDDLSLDFRRRIPVDKERDDGVRDLGGLREDRAKSIRLGAFVHWLSFARPARSIRCPASAPPRIDAGVSSAERRSRMLAA
jgi:hypothetical protein